MESLELQIVKTKSFLKLGTVLALDHETGFMICLMNSHA